MFSVVNVVFFYGVILFVCLESYALCVLVSCFLFVCPDLSVFRCVEAPVLRLCFFFNNY